MLLHRRSALVALVPSLAIAGAACSSNVEAPAAPEAVGTASQPVMGVSSFDSSCNASQQTLSNKAARYGRIVASSAAFSACIRQALTTAVTASDGVRIGPYQGCNGDPFPSDTNEQRAEHIIEYANNANDFRISCGTNVGGNADATLGAYFHSNPDTFEWNGPWLQSISDSLDQPVCTFPGSNTPAGCRWLPDPWPMGQLGGTLWHEASHQWGYTHGGNDQQSAMSGCGIPASNVNWNFQVNTIPYIIGGCINAIVDDSGSTCGAPLESGCASGQLKIVSALGSSTCTCLDDPRMRQIHDGDVHDVFTGGSGIYATSADQSRVMKFNAASGTWSTIGGPGATFIANDQGFFGITPNHAALMSYDAGTNAWTQIGGAYQTMVAGGSQLYAIDYNGNVFKYGGSPWSWAWIGGAGAEFAVTSDGTLYGLTPDRQHVMQYWENWFGHGWNQVGGPASHIVGGGAQLYAVDPWATNLYRFDGSWHYATNVNGGDTFVADARTLYRLSTSGEVDRRSEDPNGPDVWDLVDGRAVRVSAGGQNVVVVRSTGLFKMTGS